MQATRGIVLRTVKYGDNRMIVSLFTEHFGLVSVVARLSHSKKSGARSALWQLLNIVDLSMDYRVTNEIQKYSESSISSPWMDLPYHPLKASISMFLADFLYHSLKGEGENGPLFSFLENSLRWLDEADCDFSNFHLLLMIRMTRFLGFWPGMEGYSRNSIYDLKSACFTSILPSHGQYLDADHSKWIPLLLRMGYSQMNRLRMSRNERRHMLDVLLRYYRLHVPGFGELQSVTILQELFS